MLYPIVCDFKNNAVGNVEAETGTELVFMTTAQLSDLSMPLKGEVRRSPEQSARQPIARNGNLYDVLIRGERWIVKRRQSYAFSHRGAHFTLLFERGWGKRGDLAWQPAVKYQSPTKATNSNCCDRAVAQVKQHIPEQPGGKNIKY